MNTRLGPLCAATFAAAIGLTLPAVGWAGNVGYYLGQNPAQCVAPIDVITQAGHTPIAVSQLDAASLVTLDALVLATCGTIPADPDLDAAVAAGMNLVIDSSDYGAALHPYVPGASTVEAGFFCGNGDVVVPVGSPVSSGPGGALSGADFASGFFCSTTGIFFGNLPAASTILLTESLGRVTAVGYSYGSGRVAFSMSSFSKSDVTGDPWYPAARRYLTNALAWVLAEPEPEVTCASEGYTGTKLTWCRNICENGFTGATLNTWIHRWTNKYRDLPYCAAEGGGNPVPTLK